MNMDTCEIYDKNSQHYDSATHYKNRFSFEVCLIWFQLNKAVYLCSFFMFGLGDGSPVPINVKLIDLKMNMIIVPHGMTTMEADFIVSH